MPPMSCTSYGTMSHFSACPVTTTSVPSSRREASRTVANASGRMSSSVDCKVVTKDCSAFASWTLRLARSEEHTSELQSLAYLVCRLLLEKKKKTNNVTVCTRVNNRTNGVTYTT